MNEKLGGNSVEGRMDIGNDEVREQLRKLSGHLAHDFNNLLTPLLAYPQLIRQDLPSEGASRELLDVMEETAETLANISRRLGDFALPCRPAKHPVTIDTVVREVIAAIENENLALGISVKPVHDAGINVMVPHDALYGPLKAICENALEAMGGMGTLSVTANAVSIDDTFRLYMA